MASVVEILFKSKNLVYVPTENTAENKAFYRKCMGDGASYVQGTNRLLTPSTAEQLDKEFEGQIQAGLAVMVCLPPEKEGGDVTRLGFVSLDWHSMTRHHRSCSMGISMSPEHQGKGYGC
jgi:RimJ/RimL family protein N-acetyltransferase